jgi:hypothetical protein
VTEEPDEQWTEEQLEKGARFLARFEYARLRREAEKPPPPFLAYSRYRPVQLPLDFRGAKSLS